MPTHSDAERFIAAHSPRVAALAGAAHAILVREGCNSYVKTIYIGYDIDGEMVAALYPRGSHAEVALALDENHDSTRLRDASHLTWRTLPLAFELSAASDLAPFAELAVEACRRVRSAEHAVLRDNEFFVRRDRRPGSPHPP